MAEDTAPAGVAVETEEKPEQSVTIEDVGPARKKLTIELPESRIAEKIESMYDRFRDDAVLPGFRRGRAPQRLIQKRFGDDIRKDAKGQLLSESYTQAIEDGGLDVLGEPDVAHLEDLELPASGPLTYDVEVEVTPEFELPDFGDLKVDQPVRAVGEGDVADEIERYRERMGRMKPVEDEAAKVAEGDYVQADAHLFEGHGVADDAEPIQHQPDAYVLVHGEDHDFKGHVLGILVDDMGKRLTGQAPGSTVTLETTGPSGHEDERVKGQPITIRLGLQRIERLDPMPMDELLTQLGAENEDEAKEQVQKMLEQRNERRARSEMHDAAVAQLLEKVELELPEAMTGRQAERTLQRQRMELLYQGTPESEVEERMAELRASSEEDAKRELKRFFVLDRIAKDREVEVDEAELNQRIAMQAMQSGQRPEKVRQEMQQRGELQHLYMQIREQKTLDLVLEGAAVTEVEAKDDDEA